jgi:Na+-transporting methylmalonyl-CoA/oxaloacetate decarboxylase gamma subunit
MNPDENREGEDGNKGGRVPLVEQWWGGFVALIILAAAVVCMSRCEGAEITIGWERNRTAENVTEYRVHLGAEILATVKHPACAATVRLPDGPCELAIVAINPVGLSKPTPFKICFVTYQDSNDLQAWRNAPGIHYEYLTGPRFFRTKLELP